MSGYTKLFASIVTSTIWREKDNVRLVWVTMLALADKYGHVEASVPGLADLARVSRADCDDALRVLSEPDADSRSSEAGGRRIEKIDGGWKLVNHSKYREKMSIEDQREKNAAYMREYRARKDSVRESNSPLETVVKVEQSDSYANADKIPDMPKPRKSRHTYPENFEAVWVATGQRGGKSAALAAWKAAGCPEWGDLAAVWGSYMLSARVANGYVKDLSGWFNGGYHTKDWSLEPARGAVAAGGGWRSSTGDKF